MGATDAAYAAALIDGEGSLTTRLTGRNGQAVTPFMSMVMSIKGKTLLEQMASRWGGRVYKRADATDHLAETWQWVVHGQSLFSLLATIRPYLRLKGEQADCILAMEGIPPAQKIWLRVRIKELNRTGPVLKRTPPPDGRILALFVGGMLASPQGSLFAPLGLEPFSGPWPRSGMWDGTALYELPTSAPPTAANACSSPPGLLPTPAAGNFGDGESLDSWEARRRANLAKGINGNGQGTPLAVAVAMLRTPTAQLAVNGGTQHPHKRKAGGHGPTLADEVEHLLPTPQATDGNGGPRTVPERRTSRGKDHGPRLRDLAPALLPTPSVSDSHGHYNRSGDRDSEMLLPGLVRQISRGDHTSPPSAGGRPPPDGQPPPPPSPAEPETDSPLFSWNG